MTLPLGEARGSGYSSWPLRAGLITQTVFWCQQAAVTGVLFLGALGHGYGLAFERSVFQMGALLLLVAALTRLMPGRQRTA